VFPGTCAMPYHGIEADERTGITGLLVSTDFCCAAVSRLDTKSAKEDRNLQGETLKHNS